MRCKFFIFKLYLVVPNGLWQRGFGFKCDLFFFHFIRRPFIEQNAHQTQMGLKCFYTLEYLRFGSNSLKLNCLKWKHGKKCENIKMLKKVDFWWNTNYIHIRFSFYQHKNTKRQLSIK